MEKDYEYAYFLKKGNEERNFLIFTFPRQVLSS